jgi:hypothetical protein
MKKMLSTLILAVTLFVTSATAIDLTCNWKANPTNEMVSNYIVEVAKDAPVFTNFIPVVTVSGNTNVALIRGITTASAFRVRAKNIQGTSGPSNTDKYPKVTPTVPVEFIITTP